MPLLVQVGPGKSRTRATPNATQTPDGQWKVANLIPQSENIYFTEMCRGSEAGSYLRLKDLMYHSTLGLRVIKMK